MNDARKKFISSIKEEIKSRNIISAFEKIDRNYFFDAIFADRFYSDDPVPIGCGQQSDAVTTLARMINYLSPQKNSKILEIGTGSGYSTAILSALADEVVTIEYHEELAAAAKSRLSNLEIKNVKFLSGNAFEYEGNPGHFDGIIILAAYHQRPLYMCRFLKKNGPIVFPMGPGHSQQICVLKSKNDKNETAEYGVTFHEFCSFTSLIDIYE